MSRCNILTAEELSKNQTEYRNQYEYMLSVLGSNHFVITSLNNERVALQSGAFLLPGYEIEKDENSLHSSLINPKIKNLNNEFNLVYIIPPKYKKDILEELDFFNINESTLFPELEHHMNYIKSKKHTEIINHQTSIQFYNEPLTAFYNWYVKTEWQELCPKIPPNSFSPKNHNIATKELEKSIEKTLKRYLDILTDSEKYSKIITNALIKEMKKDCWYLDEKSLNRLNKKIQETLNGCGYSETTIRKKSDNVLRLIIAEYVFCLIQQFM